MAQDPIKTDQIRINPAATLPILIYETGGDLAFKDGTVTGGILFSQLAGMAMDRWLTVGPYGLGATYTSIQAALDVVPATASLTEPYTILVGPGVYQETVNIVRDGVTILGMGAILQSAAEATPDGPGAYHTIVIQEGLGTIPKNVTISGLTVTNVHSSYAAVRVVGGAGSMVGEGGIYLRGCNIQATSTSGNRPIWASSMDNLIMQGGSMTGSHALSLVYVEECANVTFDGVLGVVGCQLDYDSGGTLPSIVGSAYTLNACSGLAALSTLSPPLQSTLSGGGSLTISGCTGGAALTVSGDRNVVVQGSTLGNVALNNTTAAILISSSVGAVTGATATLDQPFMRGSVSFAASTSQAVTFSPAQSDDDYHISLTLRGGPAGGETPWVTAKTASGYTINFSAAQALDVEWSVSRRM